MSGEPANIWTRTFLPRISPFRFARWLFGWRLVRRLVFFAACLATLAAFYYAEENWRGRYAWEKFQHEWEARGETFDWHDYIPPSVPDEKNFAMAPYWANVRARWEAHRLGQRVEMADLDPADPQRLLGPGIYREDPFRPALSGDLGSLETGTLTDLKKWQQYYRAPEEPGHDPYALLRSVPMHVVGGTKEHPTTNRIYLHNETKGEPATNDFPFPPEPGAPAEDVVMALGRYSNALNQLRLAGQRPDSRFPVDYDVFPNMLGPVHVLKMKGIIQFLDLRAVAEMNSGQAAQAGEDVDLMFRVADSLKGEPSLISQLVHVQLLYITLNPIWEGMAGHAWSAEQLKDFQGRIESEDVLADFVPSEKYEELRLIAMLDLMASSRTHSAWQLRDHWAEFAIAGKWKALGAVFYFEMAPRGWFEQEKLALAKPFFERVTAIDAKAQRVDFERLKMEPTGGEEDSLLARMASVFGQSDPAITLTTTTENKAVGVQTLLNLAEVACALERYWSVNQAYPETLEELVPQFIGKLPQEIFSGEPLKYRRSEDGRFVLYSTGADGKDFGGAYRGPDKKQTGNYGWRYPAK